MKNEKLLHAIGEIDDSIIREASLYRSNYISDDTAQDNKPKVTSNVRFKRRIAIIAAVCLIFATSITAYAMEVHQYNAAVDYLTSLGIDATDISDYSRQEIKEAAVVLEAGNSNDLTDRLLKSPDDSSTPVTTSMTKVTSEQIRELTPYMTYNDVINALGETQDIGSGLYILVYEVDNKYFINIPFSGDDAQLGVTGENLLEALQPKN